MLRSTGTYKLKRRGLAWLSRIRRSQTPHVMLGETRVSLADHRLLILGFDNAHKNDFAGSNA